MKTQAHVVIHGTVQGVGFRYWVADVAESLGLTGWVRNARDNGRTVEAVFEGEQADVEEMVQRCHEGPPLARVTKVDVEYKPAAGEFSEFQITH